MAWVSGTATGHVDLLNKLIENMEASHVETATIAAAGTGYAVGDVVIVDGGTGYQAAHLAVTAVDGGGGVTAVKMLYGGGSYSVNPATPNSPTSAGAGTGLSLGLSFASNGWTILRNTLVGSEKEMIARGVGSGADEIYIGVRTFTDTNTLASNWELVGLTGFDTLGTWATQPGISPGRYDSLLEPKVEGGSYLPLDSTSLRYWFSITGRRIIIAVQVGSAYFTAYLGFYNSFSTASELPYPMVIAGSVSQKETRFNSNRECLSFIAHPVAKQSVSSLTFAPGPFQVRWSDGSWQSFNNRYESHSTSSSSTNLTGDRCVVPMGFVKISTIVAEDNFVWPTFGWDDVVPTTGLTPTIELHPTPNASGDALTPLWPVTFHADAPSNQILGELDSVFWLSTSGTSLVSEDEIIIDHEGYMLFQNAFRTESYQYIAIREI